MQGSSKPASEEPSVSWLAPANLVTGLRLAAAPFCALAIVNGQVAWAVGLYALAVATDLVDGRIARGRGETSARGALFDHASDATFVSLGLAALAVSSGEVPLVLPGLVAAAFAQYTLDSRALAGQRLRASALGRWNGIAYFVLLGTPVIRNALGIDWPAHGLVRTLAWLLVVSTLVSMLDRLRALLRSPR
jgi:phosphatidylglycerophosphate synthase